MVEKASLYYPYIHIRDVNWLKANLLLFRQVFRMMPLDFSPGDDPEVALFARYAGDSPPLLAPANLNSERVRRAQQIVAEKLKNDARESGFRDAFGEAAAASLRTDPHGFQIHRRKLEPELQDVLLREGLAWYPEMPDGSEYIEVHPRVGEAVMSTLAIACAQEDGLAIVADSNHSAPLHEFMIQKDADAVYDAWLDRMKIGRPARATRSEVFEFMITHECNVSGLTAETIRAMGSDREPVEELLKRLHELAERIPAMGAGKTRDEYFTDVVSTVLADWRKDRRNMSNFWKRFWGEGVVDPGAKFLEKVSEKIPEAAGAGVGAVAVGAALGSVVLAAGAGLGIALIVHGAKTYAKLQDSPYRYLTTMEKAGVVFRSNVKAKGARSGLVQRIDSIRKSVLGRGAK